MTKCIEEPTYAICRPDQDSKNSRIVQPISDGVSCDTEAFMKIKKGKWSIWTKREMAQLVKFYFPKKNLKAVWLSLFWKDFATLETFWEPVKKHPQMPAVQIDNHSKRGTTDHLIRSHNCSVTNTESFAIAPQRIRSHLLLLRSEYGDYFDTESSNCANSPLCSDSTDKIIEEKKVFWDTLMMRSVLKGALNTFDRIEP